MRIVLDRRRFSVAAVLLMVVLAADISFAAADNTTEENAPFGLRWGMPKDAIIALGASLQEIPKSQWGKTYLASNLPKTLNDIDRVIMSFGSNDKLWRVFAITHEFTNDDYGNQGRERYKTLRDQLIAKYGKPVRDRAYLDPNSFYQQKDKYAYALYTNKAELFADWSGKVVDLQLSLRGMRTDATAVAFIYEYKPLAADVMKAHAAEEKDAL